MKKSLMLITAALGLLLALSMVSHLVADDSWSGQLLRSDLACIKDAPNESARIVEHVADANTYTDADPLHLRLLSWGTEMDVPRSCAEISVGGVPGGDGFTLVLSGGQGKKGDLRVICHKGAPEGIGDLGSLRRLVVGVVGEKEGNAIDACLGDLARSPAESRFRLALVQSTKTLKNAGANGNKAIIAIAGIDARTSVCPGGEFNVFDLGTCRLYVQDEPSVPVGRSRVWVFDQDGGFLGVIIVPREKVSIGMAIGRSIRIERRRLDQ